MEINYLIILDPQIHTLADYILARHVQNLPILDQVLKKYDRRVIWSNKLIKEKVNLFNQLC